MREEAFFFKSNGIKLFGFLHLPLQEKKEKTHQKAGFVFCHAFADEAFRTHRELVVYARHLAMLGYPVLRFDCRGCGDSEGDFETVTLSAHLSDIRRAVDILQEKCRTESIGLLGLRFGAALAAAVAAKDNRVKLLVLWSPVMNGNRYFQFLVQSQMAHELGNFGKVTSTRKSILSNLEKGRYFDLMANKISPEVHRELLGFDPWADVSHTPKNVLIIAIPRDRESSPDIETIKTHYPEAELIVIDEKTFWFDKLFQNPVILYETSSKWIHQVLS